MKKIIFFISIIAFFSIVKISIASDLSIASEKIQIFEAPLIEDALITKYAKMAQKYLNSINEDDTTVNEKAPAPPLTYLEVYAAISSNHPTYEYFSQGQYLSTQDHGGNELYIVTVEIGYGFSTIAKIAGAPLTQIKEKTITNNGVVIGFYRWWDASGFQGGQFTYQNRSVNAPHNTMSDWITIK